MSIEVLLNVMRKGPGRYFSIRVFLLMSISKVKRIFTFESYESICAARHGSILLQQKLCGISGGENREANPYEQHEICVYCPFW